MKTLPRISLLLGILFLVSTGLAVAQSGAITDAHPATETTTASPSPGYGIAGLSSYTLTAFDFVPFDTGTFTAIGGTPDRIFNGIFEGPVRLPNGASIVSVEVEGCDGSAAGSLNGFLIYEGNPHAGGVSIHGFDTGAAAAPGCGRFLTTLSAPRTVSNATEKYFIQMGSMPAGGSVSLAALRVYYRLQVSPAPGAATFPNDVPTSHPFFRFVEALASAGITGGCGAGSYCPDQPVTRGQMAVFLSVALGLNFPN
jgi:hypothetical protein